jgi:soluble lytic murein transglycosylase
MRPTSALLIGLILNAPGSTRATPFIFDPEVAPYFQTGDCSDAASQLRLEQWERAARGFATCTTPRMKNSQQAQFLWAYSELKSGAYANAAARFDRLARLYPLLLDYERVFAARAYFASGRPELALDRAKCISTDSALDGEARILRGDSLDRLGQRTESIAEYRGYLLAYPESWRVSEVRVKLAETLDAAHRNDEALSEWRQVYLDAVSDSGLRRAEARLGAAKALNAAELAHRAKVLFENMRNRESEAAWRRVLDASDVTESLICMARYHVAQSVFKQRDRERAAPLFEAAAAACDRIKDEDLSTKALYQAARSWGSRAEKDQEAGRRAVALFERVWREHPTHSYADDARLRQAEVLDALKEHQKATGLLAGLPEVFRDGDQRGEALWRLAFRALRAGDLEHAKGWLETELRLLPREEGWFEAGRTLYWLGRVAEKMGALTKALTFYERAVREYPLSYYALLGANRLRERSPATAAALLAELDRVDPVDSWRFSPRSIFSKPAFQRGVELARLGLGAEAKRELQVAGIPIGKRGTKVQSAGEEELLWLAAVLYDRAGEFSNSHTIPRYVLTAYQRSWPVGGERKRWLLSYPRGYADLIVKHARENGQPEALQFAIVREESAFDPLQESFANAVGLTQLTQEPADRFAAGLPHDRQALRDPAINIAIGARELGHLWRLFAGNAPLAIAGYNAGEGAVKRWLKQPERATLCLDEFIESIPYDETRGYTKRVLSSYFAYRWLEGKGAPLERVPLLSWRLPR